MFHFRRLVSVIFCAAGAAIMISCAAPTPQVDTTNIRRERLNQLQKLNIYYDTTSGKAGHHFVSQSRGSCGASWTSDNPVIIGGDFPPGLRLDGHNIVGTSEQPGNWLVKLKFKSIVCQGRSYPDEDVTVYLTIQGDAPRALE